MEREAKKGKTYGKNFMDIRADDLTDLDGWAPKQFGQWLRHGLLDVVRGINASSRFDPLTYVISPSESAIDQLEEIYNLLPAKLQDAFAEGIGLAASELPNTAFGVESFRELTLLVALTGSNHGVQAMIAKLDDPAFLAAVDKKRADDVLALLFNVIAGLPNQPASVDFLKNLITRPLFNDYEYAPIAFDALVRLESNKIVDHLKCLRHLLEWQDQETEDAVIEIFAASISNQVPTSVLLKQLNRISSELPALYSKLLSLLRVKTDGAQTFVQFLTRSPRIEITSWLKQQPVEIAETFAKREVICSIDSPTEEPPVPGFSSRFESTPSQLGNILKAAYSRASLPTIGTPW